MFFLILDSRRVLHPSPEGGQHLERRVLGCKTHLKSQFFGAILKKGRDVVMYWWCTLKTLAIVVGPKPSVMVCTRSEAPRSFHSVETRSHSSPCSLAHTYLLRHV